MPETPSDDRTSLLDANASETPEVTPPPFPALPLKTQGRFIVDDVGRRVRLMGVNWNGAHEEKMIPYGLNYHSPDVISQRLVELGLNPATTVGPRTPGLGSSTTWCGSGRWIGRYG